MKKILLMIGGLLMLSCNGQKDAFTDDALSEKLTAPDGSQITFGEIISRHKGKVTLIEIWASWCGDCVKAMPSLKDTQEKHPEVDYVFISMDKTVDKWQQGIEKHALRGDHYFDENGMKGSFSQSIDVDWIPRYIIIDKNGKVVLYRAIEKDFDKINSTLESLK